jgi:signal transduction histidine kinase
MARAATTHTGTTHVLKFSVDSALLRELGERLVGKAHVALAELVKNSYDADATDVVIAFERDRIVVADNGHGMNFSEFSKFWMRIGSPHKQANLTSRDFERPVTGSKGVGRLSVQFLASRMSLITTSKLAQSPELIVTVDWREAQQAGDLTSAEAKCNERPRQTLYPGGSTHGTRIELSSLNETWDAQKLQSLAREIWALQSPFSEDLSSDDPHRFNIRLEGPNPELIEPAQRQLRAYLDIWDARLVGTLPPIRESGSINEPAKLNLEFADGTRQEHHYSILGTSYQSMQRCLDSADFEVRIFKLEGKQRHGVRVNEAREYLNKYGGVHIYDAGFHLPFYGADTDWLGIEMAHSHRLSRSALLPEQFQVSHGLNNLPTNSRIFGVVRVNTSRERAISERRRDQKPIDHLMISVTRDRLVENAAYANLRTFVRWALDLYAMEATKRKLQELDAQRAVEPAYQRIYQLDRIVDEYADEIPAKVVRRLKAEIHEASEVADQERKYRERQAGLLGALASAGMATLAFEHEFRKQDRDLDMIIDDLNSLAGARAVSPEGLKKIGRRIEAWRDRVQATRELFTPLLDQDSRSKRLRFKAKAIVDQVVQQTAVFLRGIPVNTDRIDAELKLPAATLAEWTAVFQNILVNAVNAMLDSPTKKIAITSQVSGAEHSIVFMDTGHGVNLETASELFQPFVRRTKISPERSRLGMGGTGLGLTIVKMISDNMDTRVEFVTPEYRYKTAFKIAWREQS